MHIHFQKGPRHDFNFALNLTSNLKRVIVSDVIPNGEGNYNGEVTFYRPLLFVFLYPLFRVLGRLLPRCSVNYWYDLIFARLCCKYVERMHPDVVSGYCHTSFHLFERFSGAEKILIQFDGGIAEQELSGGSIHEEYWQLWKRELVRADKIIVFSEWCSSLISTYCDPNKIKIIPLPVVNKVEDPLATIRAGTSYFLFVGRMSERKGASFFIDIIRALDERKILSGRKVVLCGRIEQKYEQLFRSIPSVVLLGEVRDTSILDYLYSNAELFLFPTMSDAFGRVLIEARGWGCKIVSTNRCGRVAPEHQYIVPFGDVNMFIEKVLEMLSLERTLPYSKNELKRSDWLELLRGI